MNSIFAKKLFKSTKNNQMEDEKNEFEQQINVEISDEMAEGVYANLAMIAHSNSEFIIDFIRLMPNVPKAKVKSRIILTPEHAVRLLGALQDNIRKYEENYGDIRNMGDTDFPPYSMNFGGPMGEA
jgi:Protein of unknown function (DUF3467)